MINNLNGHRIEFQVIGSAVRTGTVTEVDGGWLKINVASGNPTMPGGTWLINSATIVYIIDRD